MTSTHHHGDHQQPYHHFSLSYLTETNKTIHPCGLSSLIFEIKPLYGTGTIKYFTFEGLSIYLIDLTLKEAIEIPFLNKEGYFEMGFLTEGEQIIKAPHLSKDLTCENMEYYLWYKENFRGKECFRKQKRLKKLMIHTTEDFLFQNHLEEAFSIKKNYQAPIDNQPFSQPFNNEILEIITEVFDDLKQGVLKRLFLKSKILSLLTLVLEQTQSKTKVNTEVNDRLLKKLYQIEGILSKSLEQQHTIYQLSKSVGLNEFVLKKEFKTLFGKTIFEYHLWLKMEKAKKLLQHPQYTIYEISSLVGYKNPTHFSAAFKRQEGITPNKYRQL